MLCRVWSSGSRAFSLCLPRLLRTEATHQQQQQQHPAAKTRFSAFTLCKNSRRKLYSLPFPLPQMQLQSLSCAKLCAHLAIFAERDLTLGVAGVSLLYPSVRSGLLSLLPPNQVTCAANTARSRGRTR